MKDAPLTFEILVAERRQRTIQLSGPVTLTSMFGFQAKLRELPAADTVVDLSQVPYVDSAGIGCLMNAYVSSKNAGKRFALIAANDRVKAVLSHTRVDQVIPMFATVEESAAAGH